jgi:hypothetical protein
MSFISNIIKTRVNIGLADLRKAAMIWVGVGATVGGLSSAVMKEEQISSEPKVTYKNEVVERPIRFVYHASRVAGYAGWGAGIGGFTTATAPVSIPAYIYWRSDIDDKERNQN